MLKYLNPYIKADLLEMVPNTFHGPLFTDSNPYLRNFIHWNNELKESRTSLKHKKTELSLIAKIKKGRLDLALKSILYGKNLNKQTSRGWVALFRASRKGHTEIVRMLLEKGADPNIQDYYGRTALALASFESRKDVVKMLLANKADPNLQDNYYSTALMEARKFGHTEIASILEKVTTN